MTIYCPNKHEIAYDEREFFEFKKTGTYGFIYCNKCICPCGKEKCKTIGRMHFFMDCLTEEQLNTKVIKDHPLHFGLDVHNWIDEKENNDVNDTDAVEWIDFEKQHPEHNQIIQGLGAAGTRIYTGRFAWMNNTKEWGSLVCEESGRLTGITKWKPAQAAKDVSQSNAQNTESKCEDANFRAVENLCCEHEFATYHGESGFPVNHGKCQKCGTPHPNLIITTKECEHDFDIQETSQSLNCIKCGKPNPSLDKPLIPPLKEIDTDVHKKDECEHEALLKKFGLNQEIIDDIKRQPINEEMVSRLKGATTSLCPHCHKGPYDFYKGGHPECEWKDWVEDNISWLRDMVKIDQSQVVIDKVIEALEEVWSSMNVVGLPPEYYPIREVLPNIFVKLKELNK